MWGASLLRILVVRTSSLSIARPSLLEARACSNVNEWPLARDPTPPGGAGPGTPGIAIQPSLRSCLRLFSRGGEFDCTFSMRRGGRAWAPMVRFALGYARYFQLAGR
jgi:hypothetical protein